MSIGAITPILTKNSKFSTNSMNFISSNSNQLPPQNNNLVDINYGKSLIRNKNLSFGRLLPQISVDLSQKVTAGFNLLKPDDILLLGKDLKTAKTLLKNSLDLFPNVIKKILFIQDEGFESTLAIKKNESGLGEIIKLDKTLIGIGNAQREGFTLEDGADILLTEGDTLFTRNAYFSILYNKDKGLTESSNKFIQQFDFSQGDQADISRINAKHLDMIGEAIKSNEKRKVTFADVGGQDKAIETLREAIIYPFKYPDAYGNALIHGVAVEGPPGTGKTLLAEALANEINFSFIKIDAPDLKVKWVGEPTEAIRKILQDARAKQPCVVFIDEIDSVAQDRNLQEGQTHLNVVDQILTEANKMKESNEQVVIMVATNRYEVLDQALIRPGRIGLHVFVGPPDSPEACEKILAIQNKNINDNVAVSKSFNTTDFSNKLFNRKITGAGIEDIVIRAKRHAFKRTGIFEKMGNNTFKDSDLANLKVEPEDFENALSDFTKEHSKQEHIPIGFRKKALSSRDD